MNKDDIVNEINKLTAELPLRKKIAEILDHEGLELAINELEENGCSAIKAKAHKEAKDSIKDLEVLDKFTAFLENQKNRVERIDCRIAELRNELTRCQLSLFSEENAKKIATGTRFENRDLYTGDVFELSDRTYLLITESSEHPGNYAIVGTAFNKELLLQYPKNRDVLKGSAYLGNLFEDDKLNEFVQKLQEAQDELNKDTENSDNEEDFE